MHPPNNTDWHFFIMVFASFLLFLFMIRIVLKKPVFVQKINTILLLSVLIVGIGMLLGKYGAQLGLPWWIYYPIPMLMTVVLPPLILKLDRRQTIVYLILSLFSAPLIHGLFSLFLGWKEYMPFWNIPTISTFIH